MSSIKYRPEIDGLRAVAVGSVLIYHAKFMVNSAQLLGGGALGVDIFFVISGYLITSILLHELSLDKFSFLGFYERRARRILPALVVVILSSLFASWDLLLPQAFIEFSQSIVATIFFVANIFFWNQDSYLSEASQLKPMLHMWSLGVEEQFYLFSPILILLLWKHARRHLFIVICVLLIASLVLAQWATRTHPDADFYLLPTRAWELLAGAALAKIHFDGRWIRSAGLKAALTMIGGALIIGPIALYSDMIRHPNILTAVPVLGAVLVIATAGGRDPVSAMLKSWPFVAVGKISYSLYLWHVPVLVFARIGSTAPLTNWGKVGLLTLCVVLAAGTWYFIEQPFRRKGRLSRLNLLAYTGLGGAIALGVSCAILYNAGYVSRYPTIISDLYNQEAVALPSDSKGVCMRRSVAYGNYCTFGAKNAAQTYFTVGDSHMQRFSMALIPELALHNARLVNLVVGTCPYGLKIQSVKYGAQPQDCIPQVNETRRRLFLSAPPSVVFVGSRLPWYLGDDIGKKPVFTLRPNPGEGKGKVVSSVVAQDIIDGIVELLDHGHKVVLIYPVPTSEITPALYLSLNMPKNAVDAQKWIASKSNWNVTPYADFRMRATKSYKIYDNIADNPNLLRIYPEKILCNTLIKGACITHDANKIYYFDNDHLSLAGSKELLKMVMNEMAKKWPETAMPRT